ncbi:hypothetical protein MBANPS3_011519 [Mucor bainieri]
MKATDLPQEILQLIFQYLEERFPYYTLYGEEEDPVKGSLVQVQLTCRQWSHIARRVFYENVDLTSSSQKIALFLRVIQSSSDIAQAVKGLSFGCEETIDIISFSNIVKLCPNLRWDESDIDLYTPSLALHQQGYLQKLEKVSLPSMLYCSNTDFQPYNQLMLAAKKTVTSLYISQESRFALAEQLDKFINIKKLRVESEQTITLQQVSNMLNDCCPHLKSIEVESAAPTVNEQHPSPLYLLYNLKQKPQIKSLELELRPLSLQDVQRIQYMFPQVCDLFINRKKTSKEGLAISTMIIPEESLDGIFDQFFNYLSSIKHFSVDNLALSSQELLASLTIVSGHFQIIHITIEAVKPQTIVAQHSLRISSVGQSVPNYYKTRLCSVGLKLNHSQINDHFLSQLQEKIPEDADIFPPSFKIFTSTGSYFQIRF